MAGHNKWSQIKHKKAVTDAKRSKIFGKFSKLISIESTRAKGRTDDPGLRAMIERARAIDMPKENIERAVQKGKSGVGENLERVTYETYGPGGVALLIEAVTDSRNRTAQEFRHILLEMGYALAEPGSAAWAFKKTGTTWEPTTSVSISADDEVMLEELLIALDEHDDVEDVFTNAS